MKKQLVLILMSAMLALGVLGLAGCSSDTTEEESDDATTETEEAAEEEEEEEAEATTVSGEISVYSREDGSGTRSAFVELTGIEQDDVDLTVATAVISNSTSAIMTAVASDVAGIGYISLGSLSDTVTAVTVDGVEATTDNVKSGEYSISRPFNIVTTDELSDVAQDFIDFIMSAEGQAVIEENGYVAIDDDAESYTSSGLSGKIVVAGSSSVTPVMEKLAEAYMELNPDVTIEVQQSDSSTGVTMALEGTADIGMASRALKDSEIESGATATTIAMDGIAVIVNNESGITALTTEQIVAIYTGEVTTWEEVLAMAE